MSSAKDLFSMKGNLSNFLDCAIQVNLDLDAMKDLLLALREGVKTNHIECRVTRRKPVRHFYDADPNDGSLIRKSEECGEQSFFYDLTEDSFQKLRNVFYGIAEPCKMRGLKDWVDSYFTDYVKAVDAYKSLGSNLAHDAEVVNALSSLEKKSVKFIKLINSLDKNLLTYSKNLDCRDCEVKVLEVPELIEGEDYFPFFRKKISFDNKVANYLTRGLIYLGRRVFKKSKRVNKWLDELELENNVHVDDLSQMHLKSEKEFITLYAKDLASAHATEELPITMRFDERKEHPVCAGCFKTLKKKYHVDIKGEMAYIFQLRAPRVLGGDDYLRLRSNPAIPFVVADNPDFQDSKYPELNLNRYDLAFKLILAGE